jgi:hypothetical protein
LVLLHALFDDKIVWHKWRNDLISLWFIIISAVKAASFLRGSGKRNLFGSGSYVRHLLNKAKPILKDVFFYFSKLLLSVLEKL